MDAERVPQTAKHGHRGIASASLDSAQIGQVNLGIQRKLLLRKTAPLAQVPHVRADDLAPIHLQTEAGQDAAGLGTISPIVVDIVLGRGICGACSIFGDQRIRFYARR